jgi:hypothetical protein
MSDLVAIDTCVFLHLFNDGDNTESHIEQLLSHLYKKNYHLCVDSTKKISNEYLEYLVPIIKKNDETMLQLQFLRLWMNNDLHETVEVDLADLLMHRIRQVIVENNEQVDRNFVYVAYKANCCLVTNDNDHILPRRKDLKSKAAKMRGKNSFILSSLEAVAALVKVPLAT